MRSRRSTWLAAALAISTATALAAQNPALTDNPAAAVAKLGDNAYLGTWQNPSGSVRIRASTCGKKVCGTVVYANERAQADARRGGTDPLVGTQLFEQFKARGPREWRGRVFVPDMNRRVTGTATLVDEDSIRVQGCAAGRMLCRTQVWTRVRG